MFKAALSRGDFSLLDIVARQPCSSVAGTVPGKKKKGSLTSEWGVEKMQWLPSNLGIPLLVSKRLCLEAAQEN